MVFSLLFRGKKRQKIGERLYSYIREAARNPAFFGPSKFPDTVDGRFELLTLQAFLLMQALRLHAPEQRLDQLVFDTMFLDMDDALREMGTSDTQVGKKVKQMAKAFYGRSKSYHEALQSAKREEISAALARNALATAEPQNLDIFCRQLADWVVQSEKNLAEQKLKQLLSSGPDFAKPIFT
ncbi:hypothetical protein MNBD_ALPHA06-2296 [hydrothermal vent metagenome]|uniref:Ubiquinol-cytochrome c chaperone domain-containing protein n=1 Tax=hydrothermal vent metagenome TaxID=652676 RepID=A0A3B0RKZ1_9ZZZZ